jgi:hypothetical protein
MMMVACVCVGGGGRGGKPCVIYSMGSAGRHHALGLGCRGGGGVQFFSAEQYPPGLINQRVMTCSA